VVGIAFWLILPSHGGREDELTYRWLDTYRDGLRATYPSSNRAQCRATTLIDSRPTCYDHYTTQPPTSSFTIQRIWTLIILNNSRFTSRCTAHLWILLQFLTRTHAEINEGLTVSHTGRVTNATHPVTNHQTSSVRARSMPFNCLRSNILQCSWGTCIARCRSFRIPCWDGGLTFAPRQAATKFLTFPFITTVKEVRCVDSSEADLRSTIRRVDFAKRVTNAADLKFTLSLYKFAAELL